MTERRGFWGRFLGRFGSHGHLSGNESEWPITSTSPFELRARDPFPKYTSSYTPKSLGSVDTSMMLCGETSPERFLHEFSNGMNLMGGLRAVGSPDETAYTTYGALYGFAFNGGEVDNTLTETDGTYEQYGRDADFILNESDFDFILNEGASVNESTWNDDSIGSLEGSMDSLESRISEVLDMLDNNIMYHSTDASQLPSYSEIYESPPELPPSYSDLFGHTRDSSDGERAASKQLSTHLW